MIILKATFKTLLPHSNKIFPLLCILFFFITGANNLRAQQLPENWSAGLNAGYGKFLKHSRRQTFDVTKPAYCIAMDFMHQSSGKALWAKLNGRPRYGLGIVYVDYGAPDLIGKAIGMYPLIDVWLLRRPELAIYTRMAFGVGYLTKRYDRVTNPGNTAIGSHFNNYTTIGLSAEYQLTPHCGIRLAGHLSHSSNGRLRVPNLGINTGIIQMGITYRVTEPLLKDTFSVPSTYQYSRKALFGLRGSIGIKEASIENGPFYYVWLLTPHIIFPRNEKHQWETGAEIAYDGQDREAILNGEDYTSPSVLLKPWNVSVYGGHEFLFGRLGFITQLHLNVFPFLEKKNEFYTLIGGKIYLKSFHKHPRNQFYTGIFLKAHYAIAQYPSLILGGTF